jgi:serine/threonine protein kinase
MPNDPERAVKTPVPPVSGDVRIVPRKTALGSYVIIRRIAAGGMGEVWEGWLIPSSELGWQLLRGERRDLRKIAGVSSVEDELTREEKDQVLEWMRQRTEEFLKHPPDADTYQQMLDWVSPHRRLGQDYRRAIKILNPDLAKNPDLVGRFNREIEFLARLNHPNIVKVVESGVSGPHHFAAMEYVDAARVEELKLSIPEMVHVIRQTLEGLIHAHQQGVLHRDLKPSNILVRPDLSAVKLSDFGIAKALDGAVDGHLTATGVIVGTPYYLDPERARGEPSVEQSDLYSLGATLYRLLTGEPPAKAPRATDAIALIQSPQDPRWPREANPRVSEELEDALMMMLAKDVKSRLTAYETRTLLKFLDENNALLHLEPTRRQRRSNAKSARKLLKEIRARRAALTAAGEALRVAEIRKLYTLYEDCAEFQPRDDEVGVNERLHLYEEALRFQLDVVAPRGEAVLKGVKDRVSLLQKRRALELRRLERRGFKRLVRRPRRWGRSLLVAAGGLGIVAMAVLSGLRLGEDLQNRRRLERTLDMAEAALGVHDFATARSQLGQAFTDAQDLPLSSPEVRRLNALTERTEATERLDLAGAHHERLRRRVEARDFANAAEEIEAARRLLDRPFLEPAAARARDLRGLLDQDEKRIDRHSADIRVHAGLVRAIEEIEARLTRPMPPVGELRAKLDAVAQKLGNPDVVSPDSIGPAFEETRKRLAALRAKLGP